MQKTYFIADIAANHDGDLERAKNLCLLAKEAGADAAKFQHFKAVRFEGFLRNIDTNLARQQNYQMLMSSISRPPPAVVDEPSSSTKIINV